MAPALSCRFSQVLSEWINPILKQNFLSFQEPQLRILSTSSPPWEHTERSLSLKEHKLDALLRRKLLTSTKFSQTPPHLLTALVVPNQITPYLLPFVWFHFSPSPDTLVLAEEHTLPVCHLVLLLLYGVTSLKRLSTALQKLVLAFPISLLQDFVHSSPNYLSLLPLCGSRTLNRGVLCKCWTRCSYFVLLHHGENLWQLF